MIRVKLNKSVITMFVVLKEAMVVSTWTKTFYEKVSSARAEKIAKEYCKGADATLISVTVITEKVIYEIDPATIAEHGREVHPDEESGAEAAQVEGGEQ